MRSRLATIASVVALVFAVVFVLAVVGREALLQPENPDVIPTRDVVLAIQPIEAGTRIGPDMIALRVVPLDDTNSMAYTESSRVVGKVAAIDILESQLVTPNLLVEE
jgi:Flp pilus assembly protein CpaB